MRTLHDYMPSKALPVFMDAVSRLEERLFTVGARVPNTAFARDLGFMLGQAQIETQGFTKAVENLNYSSPERLLAVWPSIFEEMSNEAITMYIHAPERLANLVYAYKLGNGDVRSGDGYRYRGRGMFHHTGRANYKALGVDLDPGLLESDGKAVADAAVLFWKLQGCSSLKSPTVQAITKKVTGCQIALNERKAATSYWQKAISTVLEA